MPGSHVLGVSSSGPKLAEAPFRKERVAAIPRLHGRDGHGPAPFPRARGREARVATVHSVDKAKTVVVRRRCELQQICTHREIHAQMYVYGCISTLTPMYVYTLE